MRFEVDEDVREFRNGPVVIPRHSVIVGRVAEAKQAGRLKGRSRVVLHFEDLRIPNNPSSYSAPLRVVSIRNKEIDREGSIKGDGNPVRDAFFLFFPPTTIFQLASLPRRGPQITLRAEERVVLKLMQELEIRSVS